MSSQAIKITPFPHTPNPEIDEKERIEETESQSVSNSVSDYYSHARARTRETEELADYFCDTFGAMRMPPVAQRAIEYALDQGMDASLIYNAMDEAALAPRPSWAYAAAILRRLIAEGCFTPEAYEARQAAFRKRRGYADPF